MPLVPLATTSITAVSFTAACVTTDTSSTISTARYAATSTATTSTIIAVASPTTSSLAVAAYTTTSITGATITPTISPTFAATTSFSSIYTDANAAGVGHATPKQQLYRIDLGTYRKNALRSFRLTTQTQQPFPAPMHLGPLH